MEVDDESNTLTIQAEKRTGEAAADTNNNNASNAAAGQEAPAAGGNAESGDAVANSGDKASAAPTKWHRTERAYGLVQRTLALPPNVDVERITSKLEHGVLTLTLPKREPTPSRRKVEIS